MSVKEQIDAGIAQFLQGRYEVLQRASEAIDRPRLLDCHAQPKL